MAVILGCLVNICEMLGDTSVRIKAVDNIKILSKFRGLLGQICCTSAADDKYVDLACLSRCVSDVPYIHALGQELYA